MSKFFARSGDSDSDDTASDYSDELTSESEDHSDSDADDSSDDGRPALRNRLTGAGSDDSDSDGDVVRVVRSAKDKRFEEIEQAVTAMANGQKINDWVSAQNGKDLGTIDLRTRNQGSQHRKLEHGPGIKIQGEGRMDRTCIVLDRITLE